MLPIVVYDLWVCLLSVRQAGNAFLFLCSLERRKLSIGKYGIEGAAIASPLLFSVLFVAFLIRVEAVLVLVVGSRLQLTRNFRKIHPSMNFKNVSCLSILIIHILTESFVRRTTSERKVKYLDYSVPGILRDVGFEMMVEFEMMVGLKVEGSLTAFTAGVFSEAQTSTHVGNRRNEGTKKLNRKHLNAYYW